MSDSIQACACMCACVLQRLSHSCQRECVLITDTSSERTRCTSTSKPPLSAPLHLANYTLLSDTPRGDAPHRALPSSPTRPGTRTHTPRIWWRFCGKGGSHAGTKGVRLCETPSVAGESATRHRDTVGDAPGSSCHGNRRGRGRGTLLTVYSKIKSVHHTNKPNKLRKEIHAW